MKLATVALVLAAFTAPVLACPNMDHETPSTAEKAKDTKKDAPKADQKAAPDKDKAGDKTAKPAAPKDDKAAQKPGDKVSIR
jgi:uncharacterized protein involved in copper resistance